MGPQTPTVVFGNRAKSAKTHINLSFKVKLDITPEHSTLDKFSFHLYLKFHNRNCVFLFIYFLIIYWSRIVVRHGGVRLCPSITLSQWQEYVAQHHNHNGNHAWSWQINKQSALILSEIVKIEIFHFSVSAIGKVGHLQKSRFHPNLSILGCIIDNFQLSHFLEFLFNPKSFRSLKLCGQIMFNWPRNQWMKLIETGVHWLDIVAAAKRLNQNQKPILLRKL